MAYVNQRLQIQLELLMMRGMTLETCWAFNERWINQFYYKVASCSLFLLSDSCFVKAIILQIPPGISSMQDTRTVLYCHLWPVWLYRNIPHYFTNGGNFENKTLINPLNPELNPICYLLALLRAHHFLHVSRIRVKLLTFSLLMSYIYGAPILDVSRSHTTTQHSR